MNDRIIRLSIFPKILFVLCLTNNINGQVNVQVNGQPYNKPVADSLSLKNVIEEVVSTHPLVKYAEEALNNADARIGLAKTGYYPEADVTAAYSNLGPVTTLEIPNIGTVKLFPENNYSAALNYRQLIYDFGRTRQNIAYENENKTIGVQTVENVKQKLSLATVNNFYSLVFIQAAIKIKEEQKAALIEHLAYVEKKMATGSATEYEVLTTKVKISGIESQEVDLEAALKTQQATLNSLLGKDQSTNPVVKTEFSVDLPEIPSDSVLAFAFRNRDEVILNQRKTTLAELKYDLIRLQNKPTFNFMASGGAKNGYFPYLNDLKANYIVGLGLRIPIFDAMKTKYNLLQAKSAIVSLSHESENTKRTVSTELADAESNMYASREKISQYQLQLEQALKAYSLAEISFRSGIITNLDLLDANTSVSESRLLLLKSKIDYAASIYKLKAALGERLY